MESLVSQSLCPRISTQGVGVMLCSWCLSTRKLSRQDSTGFFSGLFFSFSETSGDLVDMFTTQTCLECCWIWVGDRNPFFFWATNDQTWAFHSVSGWQQRGVKNWGEHHLGRWFCQKHRGWVESFVRASRALFTNRGYGIRTKYTKGGQKLLYIYIYAYANICIYIYTRYIYSIC